MILIEETGVNRTLDEIWDGYRLLDIYGEGVVLRDGFFILIRLRDMPTLEMTLSVQYVADTVDYGSTSSLSRAFRSLVGKSPTEWLRDDAVGQ